MTELILAIVVMYVAVTAAGLWMRNRRRAGTTIESSDDIGGTV